MHKNFTDLTGKKAIVTGGAQGLSRGMAEGLMEAGAEVVLLDVQESVYAVAEAYAAKGFACYGVRADLSDPENREMAFQTCLDALGGHLDILVNGAGVQRRHPTTEFPYEDWKFVLEVNLNAVFSLCQLAGRQYLKQNSGGKIINIASMLSFFGGFTVPAYAASKGAVMQMTKAMCNEWAGSGINCNCLAPGYMDTEMNTALTDPANPRFAQITARIPAHVWGTPDDMKGPVVFLASEASNYLNGAVIPVDGGYLVM